MKFRAHVVRHNNSGHHFWIYENSTEGLAKNVLLFPDEFTIIDTCESATIAAEQARKTNLILNK
jgi:hypothetical protein